MDPRIETLHHAILAVSSLGIEAHLNKDDALATSCARLCDALARLRKSIEIKRKTHHGVKVR